MGRRMRGLVLLLAVTACADLLPPPGVDPYEYRDFQPGGGGTTALAFHWPRSFLPVTVYVEAESPLRASVIHAIDTWQGAFVYGELRMRLVADSAGADIIVRNEAPTKPTPGVRLDGGGGSCFGSTDLDPDRSTGTIALPFRIRIATLTLPTNPDLQGCYDATVLHEFGHAIGIFAHSSDAGDVMYVSPTRTDLSARDQATIEAVYHLPATLVPVR
ncbi:MAG TPA: hypothetical protein VFN22_01230 [Gemmatimonadales bacterium]|nr:hypothetical protein [Gemmatimonadales bacterium]